LLFGWLATQVAIVLYERQVRAARRDHMWPLDEEVLGARRPAGRCRMIGLGGHEYRIRPAGELGERERRELLEAWGRCDEHEQRERVSGPELHAWREDLRRIARLALPDAPAEVIRSVDVDELRAIRDAIARASVLEVSAVVEAARARGFELSAEIRGPYDAIVARVGGSH